MDKPAASPRRMASMRALDEPTRGTHTPTTSAADTSETVASGSASSRATGSSSSSSDAAASPRIDRGVRTRTHTSITLLPPSLSGEPDTAVLTGAATTGDRGWWSPHGEPYRPLGNPELSLKLTPCLPADSLSRSKTTAQDANAKDANGQREPSRVGVGATGNATASAMASTLPPQDRNVLEMFPRNLRKRPPEDRQARLAVRLQESMAQYSPGKVRGLSRARPITITRATDAAHAQSGDCDREEEHDDADDDVHAAVLRLQQQHYKHQQYHESGTVAPAPSPRYHVEHGDTSVYMLRGAVQHGVSRLRLVRNGQYFLSAVPSGQAVDWAVLKRQYDQARAKFMADQETSRKAGRGPAARSSGKAGSVYGDSDGMDEPEDGGYLKPHLLHTRSAPQDACAHVYFPYTTRQPQTSPHKPLPTLAEFKTKIREERMPQRTLLSSRASLTMTASTLSPPLSSVNGMAPPRKSSARPSLVNSLLVAGGTASAPLCSSPEKIAGIPQQPSPRLSRIQTRRGSIVLLGPGSTAETRTSLLGDISSDALARVVSQAAPPSPTASPRIHSVVRLQNSVDALEGIKHKQCETLSQTLTLLRHDRRDCLSVKFRNLRIESRAETDLVAMRLAAEADRVNRVQLSMATFQWYPDLLRHMLANRASPVFHPAEVFCVDGIRHVASEGHAFDSQQLYQLVLLLHPADVSVLEVQQLLTFLRRALRISLTEWAAFFKSHYLPEPVEIFKPNDAKAKDKKKQLRMAKLRTVITLSSVLRRMTTPLTPSAET